MTAQAFLDWQQERGINGAEAAHLLCTNRTQVWRWEHGATIPEDTALLCWLMQSAPILELIKKRVRFVPHRRGRKKHGE